MDGLGTNREYIVDCFYKQGTSKKNGKLFICNNATLVFQVEKKLFSTKEKRLCWHWTEIYDLSKTDTLDAEEIVLMTESPISTVFYKFQECDPATGHSPRSYCSAERVLKTLTRILFGRDRLMPLFLAIRIFDKPKLLSILDRHRSLLTKFDRDHQSPLVAACLTGYMPIVQAILNFYREFPQEFDINQPSPSGEHVLHSVLYSPTLSDAVLSELLSLPLIDVTRLLPDGSPTIHVFAQYCRSPNCWRFLEILKAKGADVNSRNFQNESPLHCAIFNLRVASQMCQWLISNGANLSMFAGFLSDTPLHYTIRVKRPDLFLLLLANGADISVKQAGESDCIEVATNSDFGVVGELAKGIQELYQNGPLSKSLPRLDPKLIVQGVAVDPLVVEAFYSSIFNIPPLEKSDLGKSVGLKWIQFRILHYQVFVKMMISWPTLRLFYLAKAQSMCSDSPELFPVLELIDQVIYLLFELHFTEIPS